MCSGGCLWDVCLWSGGRRTERDWRGTQGHGHHGEGLGLTLCAPLAWPDGWGARVGQGSARDSYLVWTLAGLRCLKHLRRVGPKSWAALSGFLEDLAKNASAKAIPPSPSPWDRRGPGASWGHGS